MSGYIASVGNILNSNPKNGGKITRFFEFYIHTKTEQKRAVCFSPQKSKYIQELSENEQGGTLKKVKIQKDVILGQDVS